MKVTREKTENSQAFLTIELEPAEVEESTEKAYRRLVNKTDIPGFRKGKAPRNILERYIGKKKLLDEALNDLMPQAYEKAISEQEIKAIAQPQIEITQTDPVVFKAVVPLLPTVELGDYKNIKVTPEAVEVGEGDVDATIEQLRHQHAIWEPVERPVDFGDLAVLDIESHVEGAPFIDKKGVQYHVLRGASFPVAGFAEQLTQMKTGETREFNLQFPSDNPNKELAGKEASFKVKVTEIKEEKLPELNDEFASQVDPDFKSLDSFREQVSTSLRLNAEEKARRDFEQKVVEAVVDITELEFPPILVEMEINQLIREQLRRWQLGDERLDDYLKMIDKTNEELREELRPLAIKRVSNSLVLEKIAEEGKIEASDSEIDDEIEKMTKDVTKNKDELNKFLNSDQSRQSIRQLLIRRKTVERLVEIAKGSDTNVEATEKEAQE